MTTRILPALCAALLLAACGSDASQDPTAPTVAALPENNGANSPIDSSGGENSADVFRQRVGDTVHFDTDSSTLTADAQSTLQKQAAWLLKYREHSVTIEGHADERGTREYNLALGDRRAQTVVNYLTALGVDPNRLKEISYGKERPICPDTGDTCWGQNRRGVTALDN